MNIRDYIKVIFGNIIDGTFIEIGAHWGTDTVENIEVAPSISRYIAFEPDARNSEIFRKNITDKRVQLIEVAVGDRDGTCELFLSSGRPADITDPDYNHTHSNSIRRPKDHLRAHPWCKFNKSISVPITRLDTIIPTIGVGDIDFIWADMQGAECDMIRGGQTVLSRTKYIYLEHDTRELYEGQVPLDGLIKMMPGRWEIVEKYSHDALLRKV